MAVPAKLKSWLERRGLWENVAAFREEKRLLGWGWKRIEEEMWVLFDLDAEVAAMKAAAAGERITKAAAEGKKRASQVEEVQWVADNLAVEDVSPDDAPSAKAWKLLEDVRALSSEERTKIFWGGLWAKLLPSKAEMDEAARFEDDGREVLSNIEAIERASADARGAEPVLASCPEGDGGESSVPA
jgi:hypothetical protein